MLILIEDNQGVCFCPKCVVNLWTRALQCFMIADAVGNARNDSDYRIIAMQLREFANKLAEIIRDLFLIEVKYV